jgi:hypothetical protein
MKINYRYNRPVMWLLSIVLLGPAACKKSFYADVNANPNAPSAVSITPSVLLSGIEGSLGYMQGGDLSRFASLNIQQVKGSLRQVSAYYQYIFTSTDFDVLWANIFTPILQNDNVLQQLSDAKGFHAYSGVSRILKAYVLQLTVDTWGSVPYSKAFQGATNLKPTYDTDKGLYDSVANLLDAAIVQLNNPNAGALVPGDEDVIYGGKTANWIKFAHAIKARLYLHQSKGNATMAAKALSEIALSFSSNDDNAKYVFGNTETSANPWYQFNEQRGDISFSTGLVAAQMTGLQDPRLPILIDTTAADHGDGLNYFGVIDAPVEFITYDELLFATAEAVLRNGGSIAAARGFYQSAIRANMTKLGVKDADIATYIAANGTLPTATDAAIAQVSAQEYLALYLNPEAWTLWRRTNSPALTPIKGSGISRRLLYPQTEYSYNGANVPPSVTLFSPKIFWDN